MFISRFFENAPLAWRVSGSVVFVGLPYTLALVPVSALANPSGEQVIAGHATFDRTDATLSITQSTDRAIIHWQDFSIGAGQTTRFIQPSSQSAILNRVVGDNVSSIYGNLRANGQVMVINPNGIAIGSSGRIDAAGFLASTLDTTNEMFLSGGDMLFTGNSQNAVVNLGTVEAIGGDAMLIGRYVENRGSLRAADGTVAMAAGTEVLVRPAGSPERIMVLPSQDDRDGQGTGVLQAGTVDAVTAELKASGNAYAMAINNEGAVRATGVEQRDGRIMLTAGGGMVRNSGTLATTSDSAAAAVEIRAESIETTATSRIEATAESGETSRIDIVATDALDFEGAAETAAGGFVELSGHQQIRIDGEVQTHGGLLYIDPIDFTIGAGGNIGGAALATLLGNQNVVIETASGTGGDGDILVNQNVMWDSEFALGLLAHRDIRANAYIRNSGTGAITLVAGWDGGTGFTIPGTDTPHNGTLDVSSLLANPTSYGNNNGSVFINSALGAQAVAVGTRAGQTTVLGHDVILRSSSAEPDGGRFASIGWNAFGINTDLMSGDIVVQAKNDIQAIASNALGGFVRIGHGGSPLGIKEVGDASGNIDLSAGGDISFISGQFGLDHSQLGHGGTQAIGNFSGDITIHQARNITFAAGGVASYSQLGHGGLAASGNYSGAISIQASGDLTLQAGSFEFPYAQIGHGGFSTNFQESTGTREGNIDVRVAGATTLQDNVNTSDSRVWNIGHLTSTADGIRNAEIYLQTGALRYDTTASDVTLINQAFVDRVFPAMAGGNVTIASTGAGGIQFNGNTNFNQASDLTLLSTGDIRVNRNLQNSGTGAITVLAGWDGSAGVAFGESGPLFDFDGIDLALDSGQYGNNDGLVFINSASGTQAVAVGSRAGQTTVMGHDITLRASDGANDRWVQIGWRAPDENTEDVSGDIVIRAANQISATAGNQRGTHAQIGHGGGRLIASNVGKIDAAINLAATGDFTFSGGSGDNAYAQLGHAGLNTGGDHRGTITIAKAGDLSFTGGAGVNDYAQLGHGGRRTRGDHGGDILIRQIGNLTFTGGSDGNGYAQLGHGGSSSESHRSGNIHIEQAGDLNFSGGIGSNAYVQLGHSGHLSAGDSSGGITIHDVGNLTFEAGNMNAFAHLGHGGLAAVGDNDGAITIHRAGVLSFEGGEANAYAQLGHGGRFFDGNSSGTITIHDSGNLVFTGGIDSGTYAQVGHTGNISGFQDGAIAIQQVGNLIFTGGNSVESSAQVGHRGQDGGLQGGAITVRDAGDLIFTGGGVLAFAQLGHRGGNADGAQNGHIFLHDTGAITFTGGGVSAHAHLGHWGGFVDATQSGDISIQAAEDLTFAGGEANAYAQLGHKGNSGGNQDGDIMIDGVGSLNFEAGEANAYVQIGHGGLVTGDGQSGDITIQSGGGLTLRAGSELRAYAIIGHGGLGSGDSSTTGTREGNIDVRVAGTTIFQDSVDSSNNRIWHLGHATSDTINNANVVLQTGALEYGGGGTEGLLNQAFADRLSRALDGGNVTVEITGLNGDDGILRNTGLWDYTSANTLTLISSRDVFLDAGIENDGSGALLVVSDNANPNRPDLNEEAVLEIGEGVNLLVGGGVRLFAVDAANVQLGGFTPENRVADVWFGEAGAQNGLNTKMEMPTDPLLFADVIALSLDNTQRSFPWISQSLMWKLDQLEMNRVDRGFPIGSYTRNQRVRDLDFSRGLPPNRLGRLRAMTRTTPTAEQGE